MSESLTITFGDRVAENESQSLSAYFIKTEHWTKVREGKVDIVFGSKGAGKSALYTLLFEQSKQLQSEGITLISAENPTGQPVFSEIRDTPPTKEIEFVSLWKIYICQLIVKNLVSTNNCRDQAEDVRIKLVEAGLIEENSTLKKLLNAARKFAKRIMNAESIEGGGSIVEGGITGKITLGTPDSEKARLGYVSIDELLEGLNSFLINNKLKIWILFDRLDVAFDQDAELEKNALRALFKTYRDIENLEAIHLKIFLRDDIWKRITDEGFRESSHITRTTTLKWTPNSLLNLIITRAIKNQEISNQFNVDATELGKDHKKQSALYYQIFPEQVDVGEKQSDTFDWILNRVKDGFGNAAPREVIHFHNEIVNYENESISIGTRKIEPPNIFGRQSIKSATLDVSKVKTEQNMFAENPHLKSYIQKLEGNKAEQNLETLAALWDTDEEKTKSIANELVSVAFFEQRAAKDEGVYKIPFLYRPYLSVTQGKAFS